MPTTRTTILIVDDDAVLRESLQAVLERKIGRATILVADSAKQGIRLLAQRPVDLVLSDFQLPDMDGVEFLRQAREANPTLHCLLMTGYPAVGLAVRAQKEAKIDGMALKPFDAEQIVQLVQGALRGGTTGFQYAAPS